MQKQVVAAIPLLTLLFSTSVSAQDAQPQPRIVAVDLGTLYPDGSTEPRAINERGTVVGVARRPDLTETAFMWTRAEGFTALVDDAVATDVNNRGEVVGWVNTKLWDETGDEEKARAKERVFSFRDEFGQWDPKNQRPELWNLYNARVNKGESIRVFPLSNWTELDIWLYIFRENIPVVPLYFAKERPVVVDMWAAWCGPCRQLTPTLEKVADERSGAFLLAKLDTDANPLTASAFIPAARNSRARL